MEKGLLIYTILLIHVHYSTQQNDFFAGLAGLLNGFQFKPTQIKLPQSTISQLNLPSLNLPQFNPGPISFKPAGTFDPGPKIDTNAPLFQPPKERLPLFDLKTNDPLIPKPPEVDMSKFKPIPTPQLKPPLIEPQAQAEYKFLKFPPKDFGVNIQDVVRVGGNLNTVRVGTQIDDINFHVSHSLGGLGTVVGAKWNLFDKKKQTKLPENPPSRGDNLRLPLMSTQQPQK